MIQAAVLLVFVCTYIQSSYSIIWVEYPSYPTIPEAPINDLCLNSLAIQYVIDNPFPSQRSNPDFVFVYVPVRAFKALKPGFPIFGCSEDDLYGLLYWSGYWGGIWLRARLQNPPAPLNPAFLLPSVSAAINNARAAATSPTALTYISTQFVPVVFSFAYNAGYFRIILDRPPTGVTADPAWNFTYYPARAVDATFTTPEIRLNTADSDWVTTVNTDTIYTTLKNNIVGIQGNAYNVGVQTWSNATGLNVVGFNSRDYNKLLEASSVFLEIAQTNAIRVTRSSGLQSNTEAQAAAKYNGFLQDFNLAYRVGLLDGVYDASRPNTPFPKIKIIR